MEHFRHFQKALPEGYREVYHLDARKPKVGVIMNLIALGVLGVVLLIAYIPLARGGLSLMADVPTALITYLAFLASIVLYTVLHELVHGAAYKRLTGEKLTFGMSWSCAFCGVPHIFTYRKTAIIATVAPFAVFTLLFIPILILFYFFNPFYYLLACFLFGLHLGGCSGDLYVLLLLTFKFKNKKTLIRDTGPEQFFLVPGEEN